MVFSTITHDRKNQTMTFMMSLPVSYKEYVVGKFLANTIVAGGAWLFLYGILSALILLLEPFPDGMFPFATLTMLYMLMIYFVLFSTAMITESEAVIIVIMSLMNLTISLFMIWMGNSEQIGHLMQEPEAVWTPLAKTVMFSEIAVMVIAVALAAFMQSRKKNYL